MKPLLLTSLSAAKHSEAANMSYYSAIRNRLFLVLIVCFSASSNLKSQTIAAGTNHSLSIGCPNGTPLSWGYNGFGQLGDGSNANRNIPGQVSGLIAITAIFGGYAHSLFLKNDGTVWACGYNADGQLGDGTNTDRNLPVQISGLNGITAISGRSYHSLFLKNDGTVWACGYNNSGQLGDGSNTDRNIPVQVSGLSGITSIAGGGAHSLFLKNDGTVWTCGYNYDGQLGDGTNINRNTPVQVSSLIGITAIAGGGIHSLFLKNDGTVWACGRNAYGQLGDGTNTDRNLPVQISGLNGITAINGGHFHSLFLKSDGTVWACGYNFYGQLGDGSDTNRNIPVQVSGLSGITSIAGGGYHSLFLKNDGTAWACGENFYGQLGDGSNTDRDLPVQVAGLPICVPEINVQGNGTTIFIGDNSPSLYDHTDFSNVNTTSYSYKTYKIENYGLTPLLISSINLSGADASMFNLGAWPTAIPAGGIDSFTVYFYPFSPGLKSATVTINNNDSNEGVYNFTIQGTGILPKYVYTTQAAANTVGVVDRNTNQHFLDINVGSYPNGLCFNPSKSKLYVSNSASNSVSVIHTFSNTVEQTIMVGNYPIGLCTSPDGSKLYVANQNSNSISVINLSTLALEASISVGNLPFGICISLDGSKVYVSNNGSNTVSVINTNSNTVTATLNVGLAPKGITINPSGTIVYVANSGSNNVSSFNVSNHAMNPNVSVGTSPYSICFNASGTKYFVSNYYGFTVSAVPIVGGFYQTIPVGNYPAGMSLSEDGTQLWVTNYGSDNMSVINTASNSVVNTVAVGSGPISFGNSIATIGVPEMKVKGGGLILPSEITNYDYTPSAYDNTDFGTVNAGNTVTKTFYLQNAGSSDLVISVIEMYGPDTSMFDILNIPTTIPAGVTDSFTITFTPTSSGTKLAYIHIASNVPNLSNFYFGIQGEGIGSLSANLNLKFFIEGYYMGASLMQAVLFNQGGPAAGTTQVDQVTVELREAIMPYNLAYSSAGILNTDGTLQCTYPYSIVGNNYYLRLTHRNAVETWSANPMTMSTNTNYDFSVSNSQSYGNNQTEVEPGIWAFYSGDLNQDENVDLLDASLLETDINNFEFGYFATDINGDGNVDLLDSPIMEANINQFIFSSHP